MYETAKLPIIEAVAWLNHDPAKRITPVRLNTSWGAFHLTSPPSAERHTTG
ncbi:hypothetical protein [Spirosoma sp. KNUC1025]|uniref:hypothetical protein n=1 Tax=Spirosoma sp. KNUC1025 TaxID=2894082 RepID=UPI00386692C9|nr:hypothetical protein LN737_32555 [Spirosoma sp. KNUC1025]